MMNCTVNKEDLIIISAHTICRSSSWIEIDKACVFDAEKFLGVELGSSLFKNIQDYNLHIVKVGCEFFYDDCICVCVL